MENVSVPPHSAAPKGGQSAESGVKPVADFDLNGVRVVAFLEGDQPYQPGGNRWPQVAEQYAAEHGISLSDARWYSVQPFRFANGRPNINEFRPANQSWRFETGLNTASEIVRRLGLDMDTLPLDL